MEMWVHSFFIAAISRMLLRSDRRSGRMERILSAFAFAKERLVITSGSRRLSAVYVSAGKETPAVLICHGIGELVEYWGEVQGLLKEMGISSLVFNYSGYGTSSGRVSPANCEEDGAAAYRELIERGHASIVLLGFSLGTGVVCAIASQIKVAGVVLCEGFSSLREAGVAMGIPRWFTRMVADVWATASRVGSLDIPVLVVHSDRDELFPLAMAEQVAEACGERGELIVVKGLQHNAPIFAPTPLYWQPIADWIKRRSAETLREGAPPAEASLR
jgi:fermentation-respiration switch protein FrsA (DUF1100 family)